MKLYAQLDVFDKRSENLGLVCPEKSKTQQSQRDEADINAIVARFIKTGIPPDTIAMPPTFADLTEIPTFQEARQMIIDAEAAFMQLPADVRYRFENNAGEFLQFAENPANIEQLRSWGLAVPKPVVDTPPAVIPTP